MSVFRCAYIGDGECVYMVVCMCEPVGVHISKVMSTCFCIESIYAYVCRHLYKCKGVCSCTTSYVNSCVYMSLCVFV